MEVFLLRHATRNFTLGDAPLNDEGLEQAQALAQNPQLQKVTNILASPKKRAQMTISPLAEQLALSIQTEEALDQMRTDETEAQFKVRVGGVLKMIEEKKWDTPLLLCTHSDWLSMATQILPSDAVDLKHHMFHCAEFIHFKIKEGLWLTQ